jgi:membrane-bound lytic murein transglycosylase A
MQNRGIQTGSWWPLASLLFLLAACSTTQKVEDAPPRFEAVAYGSLPGWQADDHGKALESFLRSCPKLTQEPWKGVCDTAKNTPTQGARSFFETYFTPYRVTTEEREEGLFTGYHESLLEGSLTPLPGYEVPLYPLPDDLLSIDLAAFDLGKGSRSARVEGRKILPYPDRTAIETGALTAKPIAWAKDAVEVFFMHIQGSGQLQLPDGTRQRIGYAGQNGRQYVAIGKKLIERSAIPRESVTAQSIKAWLRANPEQSAQMMRENPSYIFFRLIDGDGPIGAQGVALTPERSLAVDKRFIPLGSPIWLDTTAPDNTAYQRLMIAQDTGGAIKGAIRGDIFWGSDLPAAETAGLTKQKGRWYVLLPRGMDAASLAPKP